MVNVESLLKEFLDQQQRLFVFIYEGLIKKETREVPKPGVEDIKKYVDEQIARRDEFANDSRSRTSAAIASAFRELKRFMDGERRR